MHVSPLALGVFVHLSAAPGLAQVETGTVALTYGSSADSFGSNVAISGDVALVEAKDAFPGPAVHLFERDATGNWNHVNQWLLTGGGSWTTNAMDVEGNVAVVGDYRWGSTKGRALVLERGSDGTWAKSADLVPGDFAAAGSDTLSWFGWDVVIEGDRILASALDEPVDDQFGNVGGVYVFERDGLGAWVETGKFVASDGVHDDGFGKALALEGDRALVAAREKTVEGDSDAGCVYAFERATGGTWTEVAQLTEPAVGCCRYFGSALAMDGGRALIQALPITAGSTDVVHEYRFDEVAGWQYAGIVATPDPGASFSSGVRLDAGRALIRGLTSQSGFATDAWTSVLEAKGQGGWVETSRFGSLSIGTHFDLFEGRAILSEVSATTYPPGDPNPIFFAGAAHVYDFPSLHGVPEAIGAATGGTQAIELDAPAAMAGFTYLVLGSLSGTSPGVAIDGFVLPLNPDPYLTKTLTSPTAPPLTSGLGLLDDHGDASITLTLAPNPAVAGLTVHHAALVLELTPTLLAIRQATGAVALELLP